MKKEDITTLQNDIKSLKCTRRVIKELILNFPENAKEIRHEEEFLQLCSTRICLDKTIMRMQHLLEKNKSMK